MRPGDMGYGDADHQGDLYADMPSNEPDSRPIVAVPLGARSETIAMLRTIDTLGTLFKAEPGIQVDAWALTQDVLLALERAGIVLTYPQPKRPPPGP